jgi:hypothetical protein
MAKAKTTTEKTTEAPEPARINKVTVEITVPNGQLISRFLGFKLRGRWSLSNERGRTSSRGIMSMPDIPGQHLTIDVLNGTSTVSDPLEFEENRDTYEQARAAHRNTFGTDVKPVSETHQPNLSESALKTALWEIAGWIEVGHAEVVSGYAPTREEVALMAGHRRINQFDNSPNAPKHEGDIDLRGEAGIVNAIQLGQGQR